MIGQDILKFTEIYLTGGMWCKALCLEEEGNAYAPSSSPCNILFLLYPLLDISSRSIHPLVAPSSLDVSSLVHSLHDSLVCIDLFRFLIRLKP